MSSVTLPRHGGPPSPKRYGRPVDRVKKRHAQVPDQVHLAAVYVSSRPGVDCAVRVLGSQDAQCAAIEADQPRRQRRAKRRSCWNKSLQNIPGHQVNARLMFQTEILFRSSSIKRISGPLDLRLSFENNPLPSVLREWPVSVLF